jgi:hypothetical protein
LESFIAGGVLEFGNQFSHSLPSLAGGVLEFGTQFSHSLPSLAGGFWNLAPNLATACQV